MSDHFSKSENDVAGTSGQSMHHFHAAWMDHWKPSSRPSTDFHSLLMHRHGLKDDHSNSKMHPLFSGSELAINVSKNAQGFMEVSEARTVEPINKCLTMGSMKLEKEILDGKPLPKFNISGNRENAAASKRKEGTSSNSEAVKHHFDLNDGHNSITMGRSEWAQHDMECSSRECKFQPEGISWVPDKLVKSHEFLEHNSLAVSTIFKDEVGPSSKIVPYVVKSGVAPMQSFACQAENNQLCPVVPSKEHGTDAKFCSYSTFWVREKKADTHFESRKLESSLARPNDAPLLLHDQSTKNSQLCSFLNRQSQKEENGSGIKLLPSLDCPEEHEPGKGYDGHFLLPSIPHPVHDVKTMRICTTIDSVEEIPRGPSKFSQTTHQFFITKKTGVNLTKGGQVFKDAMVSPKFKGNMFSEFLSLSPTFNLHSKQGVKLQPLGSSTDSEGKDNVGDVRTSTICLKNESSVETDAMELDIFQKNRLSSMALCPSEQNIEGVHNSSLPETENATGEEARDKMANTELPDMNEGLPAFRSVSNSMDNGESSTSRTQSLDAGHLISHAEQPSTSKTAPCSDGHLGPEPSSRWVKRLKLSKSEPFALGTKSSNIGEVSSHVKVNKIFSKIMNCSKTSSAPKEGRSHVRPQLALDQTAKLIKNGESTSSGSVRRNEDIAHAWIHRWCRYKAVSPKKKPEAAVLCKPQSSKATVEELQKQQFPSIAAMALMGKAMNGFHPCEIRKEGSTTVWST
ncbi:F-box protein [Corchorus olitorius]|uniref:F-box protein n=1 Tax=Corchorus olitorius TaxID=93759 RepID=A0A1R3HZ60_9ROSI|nr:F-box protein [Corchorus olitorius]